MYANWKNNVSRKLRLEFRKFKWRKGGGVLPKVRIASKGLWNSLQTIRNIFLRCCTSDLWNKKKEFFEASKVGSPLTHNTSQNKFVSFEIRVILCLTFYLFSDTCTHWCANNVFNLLYYLLNIQVFTPTSSNFDHFPAIYYLFLHSYALKCQQYVQSDVLCIKLLVIYSKHRVTTTAHAVPRVIKAGASNSKVNKQN